MTLQTEYDRMMHVPEMTLQTDYDRSMHVPEMTLQTGYDRIMHVPEMTLQTEYDRMMHVQTMTALLCYIVCDICWTVLDHLCVFVLIETNASKANETLFTSNIGIPSNPL